MSKDEFRFRLNGIYIHEIRVQRALVNGEPGGELEIAVRDEIIGWFVVDDNSHLPDRHLSRFVLEYRNETAWSQVDPVLRRMDKQKGWHTVSPRRLLKVLRAAGHIEVDV